MHSMWSDGRDSIEAMVEDVRALGYEYMAITDHSPHSAASRNLTVDGVKQQADEIARAARALSARSTILHGCEVDILPGRQARFPDRVLERFDIVLASLHERGRPQSPEQLLTRYVAAMRHPLVTIITHPTNRLVPHRRGYDLDYDRLFATAVRHGTVRRNRRRAGAPRHGRRAGAAGHRRRRHGVDRQRLPSRGDARPADGIWAAHGATRLGRAAPRPQHAAARRGARD